MEREFVSTTGYLWEGTTPAPMTTTFFNLDCADALPRLTELQDEAIEKVKYRVQEWEDFASKVTKHLIEYTIPQYGDYPYDQMTTASTEDIIHNMKRYLNRAGTNARGPKESLRDMLKMAHYACMLYNKLEEKFHLSENNHVEEV